MARWFRMHESTLDDPKVQQRLSDSQFRAWVNLLCLACRHDGVLPPLVDIAFALRRTEKEAAKVIAELIKHELIDETETGIEPHNWHGRQYKSDVSNERVKRHRQRTRNVTSPVTATPSESEADTEQSSEANASGGAPPSDPVKLLFDAGVELLTSTGCKEPNARSLLGKWRKDVGDDAVMGAIAEARRLQITEPIAWMTQRFAGKPGQRESWNEARIRKGQELLRQ
jgi:hypothetical protein